MKKIISATSFLLLFALNSKAQFPGAMPAVQIPNPLHLNGQVCNLPSSVAYTEFLFSDAAFKGDRCMVTPVGSVGYQMNAASFSTRIDANSNAYSKAVGGYFSAEVFGKVGQAAEAVGVYARTEPATPNVWSTALHGECRNRTTGAGICMGLNVELRDHTIADTGKQSLQTFIGINVQPGDDQRGVIGQQFQNRQAYKHSMDFNGTFVKLGDVDGVGFCIKFGGKTGREQIVEFWRGCGEPGATRHGYVDMNWNAADVKLNR